MRIGWARDSRKGNGMHLFLERIDGAKDCLLTRQVLLGTLATERRTERRLINMLSCRITYR